MIIWDMIHFCFILSFVIIIPFTIAFHDKWSLIYRSIGISLLTFNIFMFLNTSRFIEGILVQSRVEIMKRFLNKNAIIDLISIGCFISESIWIIFFLVKIVNLREIYISYIESDKFLNNKKIRAFNEIIGICFQFFMFVHLFACVLLYVAHYEILRGLNNWITVF